MKYKIQQSKTVYVDSLLNKLKDTLLNVNSPLVDIDSSDAIYAAIIKIMCAASFEKWHKKLPKAICNQAAHYLMCIKKPVNYANWYYNFILTKGVYPSGKDYLNLLHSILEVECME